MSGLYAVLEIGTTRTVLAAAEPSAGDRMKVNSQELTGKVMLKIKCFKESMEFVLKMKKI